MQRLGPSRATLRITSQVGQSHEGDTLITATITNIVKEGNGIRVFVEYSNDGSTEGFLFSGDRGASDIQAAIGQRVAELNSLDTKVSDLQADLIGQNIGG